MPAVNPRITITLTPQVHAVLRRMSELTEQSQSSIVGELLSESLPVFERMTEVLEAAKRLKDEAASGKDNIRAGLVEAQEQLEKQLGLAMETMDGGFRPILDAAEKLDRRKRTGRKAAAGMGAPAAPARPATAGPTPLSNRGVTPHQKGQKQAKSRSRQGGQ